MAALWSQVANSHYLQADETPVKILRPDKKGYMWAYQGLDPGNRFVAFEFNVSRAASVPENRLQHFAGLLQTDGYAGYSQIGQRAHVTHLGCFDRARRKFVSADKICGAKGKGVAAEFIKLLNKLYKIERALKAASPEVCYQVRQAEAKPIWHQIIAKANSLNVLPQSALGKAIGYLLNNQRQLSAYLEHGIAQISNCQTENIIRPFAVGRKNWMFVGNEASANKSALLYSLIQTCKLNGINVRRYLIYALSQAPAMRRGDIDPRLYYLNTSTQST